MSKKIQDSLKALRQFAKKSKRVEISGRSLVVRLEDIIYELVLDEPLERGGEILQGTFKPEVLDVLMLDLNAPVAAYLMDQRVSDLPTLPNTIETVDIDKELFASIEVTNKCVSTDAMRPALCKTYLEDGRIYGTDGYRMAILKFSRHLPSAALSTPTIGVVKKLHKYGYWQLDAGENVAVLHNQHFWIIDTNTSGTPPPIDRVVENIPETDTKIVLPYKALKQVTSRERSNIRIGEGGEISLEGELLPLKAALESQPFSATSPRFIIMPMVKQSGLTEFDFRLLSHLKPDKDGNVELYIENQASDSSHSMILVV